MLFRAQAAVIAVARGPSFLNTQHYWMLLCCLCCNRVITPNSNEATLTNIDKWSDWYYNNDIKWKCDKTMCIFVSKLQRTDPGSHKNETFFLQGAWQMVLRATAGGGETIHTIFSGSSGYNENDLSLRSIYPTPSGVYKIAGFDALWTNVKMVTGWYFIAELIETEWRIYASVQHEIFRPEYRPHSWCRLYWVPQLLVKK